ncbi:GL26429 [Drosophila persimilis]|uniref:GL26429 n=1 Tax=Drosophila persimilis TaxID=7234 RepID=B4GUQ4_DROPE|nr:GL26429 [Drosophila persimilis]
MKLILVALCLISLLPLLFGLEISDVQQALGMPQRVVSAKQLPQVLQQERVGARNLDSLRGLG